MSDYFFEVHFLFLVRSVQYIVTVFRMPCERTELVEGNDPSHPVIPSRPRRQGYRAYGESIYRPSRTNYYGYAL